MTIQNSAIFIRTNVQRDHVIERVQVHAYVSEIFAETLLFRVKGNVGERHLKDSTTKGMSGHWGQNY